ncbi:aldehyde dehydrogenase family protein [Klebsiella variicola subsp. variicola]|nr:aldehyde dehydrogenase family protein [Klebsiella variicola subsp. variicola]
MNIIRNARGFRQPDYRRGWSPRAALADSNPRSMRLSLSPRQAIASGVGRALAERADARPSGRCAPWEEVAQMITLEMGKPIAQARGEVKSANLCDWYAEHGPAMLATEATQVENNQAVIDIVRWAPF